MEKEIYTKITELTPAATIEATDDFIISRTVDNNNNYVSYRCNYDKLSSAMKNDVMDQIGQAVDVLNNLGICKDINDLKERGTRLVQENVIWAISDSAGSGSQGDGSALLKNTQSQQTVSGPVVFQQGLSCGNSSVRSSVDVVNYQALSSYVATADIMPFFMGCSGTDPETIIANGKKALIYPIPKTCMAQITIYATQNYPDFGIFAYCVTCHDASAELSDLSSMVQENFNNGVEISFDDYCVMQSVNIVAGKATIINLPMRSKNILVFFPKCIYDNNLGILRPDDSVTIASGTLKITVVKYESFSS